MRQSNLQLQNETELCFVEYEQSSIDVRAGLSDAHHGLQDRILLNYTRIQKEHKVRKKTFDFSLFLEVQQAHSCYRQVCL